jgi:hypothetical protein
MKMNTWESSIKGSLKTLTKNELIDIIRKPKLPIELEIPLTTSDINNMRAVIDNNETIIMRWFLKEYDTDINITFVKENEDGARYV